MRLIKRITISFGYLLLAACFGAWLFFGWSGTGWKALAIPTGSMRPTLPIGSMVFVHRVPVSSLKVGDVITYTNPRNPKMTISHRIIKTYLISGIVPGFVTKGDANQSADVPIPAGLVQGKVMWHVPDVGYALIDAKKPIIILPIVYLAALLIMIEEVQRLSEYYRRFILYRLPGYRRHEMEPDNKVSKRVGMGAALTTALVVAGLAISPAAYAALKSNTVVLANNRISVAKICDNKGQNKDNHGNPKDKCNNNGNGGNCGANKNSNNTKNCTTQCSNNVNVNTNTNQTATTGNTHSSGSGNATSGNVSNNSSTNININVSNC